MVTLRSVTLTLPQNAPIIIGLGFSYLIRENRVTLY